MRNALAAELGQAQLDVAELLREVVRDLLHRQGCRHFHHALSNRDRAETEPGARLSGSNHTASAECPRGGRVHASVSNVTDHRRHEHCDVAVVARCVKEFLCQPGRPRRDKVHQGGNGVH